LCTVFSGKTEKVKKNPESGEIRTENSWSCFLTVFRLHLAQRGHNPREISSKQGWLIPFPSPNPYPPGDFNHQNPMAHLEATLISFRFAGCCGATIICASIDFSIEITLV